MAKGKLSPRQKMINLMYLVFIAMLAMQIDQEIIRSYEGTNNSLEETRRLTEDKNSTIFERTLDAKAQNSPETFGVANTQYKEMKVKVDGLVSFIDGLKNSMKTEAGYVNGANAEDNFSALNDTEPSTKTFFKGGDESYPAKTSEELKTKIADLKTFINQTFGASADLKSLSDRANKTLVTDFPKNFKSGGKSWLQYKFYNQPLIAALSNLEVIQSEARNLQSDALSLMLKEKVDADIKFSSYEAVVAAPNVIIQGENAEARIFIAGQSNMNVNITGVDRVTNGQGFRSLATGSVGENTISGTISYTDAKGKSQSLPFTHTYRVVSGPNEVKLQSGALLSADKMNVLYRGVSNPISGSILGADNGAISLSAPGCSVSGGKGKWNVTPGSGNTVKLTISGKDPHGKTIAQGFDFRIKNVPPPQGQIRGENELSMPASSIANQTVGAAIPEFDFPVTFQVTSFKFKVPGKAAMFVNGSSLSSVAGLTKNLRSGDIVYIAGIQATATGLGGQTLKRISPVVINVQ